MAAHSASVCVQRIMKGETMNSKQIKRIIIQGLLVTITTFIILEFYIYDAVPYIVKWIATIVLIVVKLLI